MDYTFLVIALICAIVNWFAIERKRKYLEYFSKPAVMIFLIIWLIQEGSLSNWMIWFVLGAVFSLAGDIFLMFPQKFFLLGLISFLLAHVSYIVGINRTFPSFTPIGIFIFIAVVIIAWRLFTQFKKGMEAKKMSELIIPVLFYVIIISLMTMSALSTIYREDWSVQPAMLISGGAILFFISDSIIGWERFISPISHGRLKTMITYHLAQMGILIGAAMHFIN
jgi:uncharacterized membrane protein YhhN